MTGSIKKSKQQLKNLGISTTYVVASRIDGKFIIIDASPRRLSHSPKPPALPLCFSRRKVKYDTYGQAFDEILIAQNGGQS